MRKTFSLILLFISLYLLTSCSSKQIKDKIEITPSAPKPGDEIVVYYDAAKTNLKASQKIDLVAYSFNVELEETKLYPMTKEGNLWKTNISTSDKIKGLVLKFEDTDNSSTFDANDSKGYLIPMYMQNGNPMPHANAGYAYALVSWGSNAGIETDKEAACNTMKSAIDADSSLLNKYLSEYCYTIKRLERDSGNPIIKEILDNIATNDSLNVSQLKAMAQWYSEIGDDENGLKYKDKLIKEFPNSIEAAEIMASDIFNIKNVEEKIELLNKVKKNLPNSEKTSVFYSQIALSIWREGDIEKTTDFLLNNIEEVSLPYTFYIASGITSKNPELGKKIYTEALKFTQNELSSPQNAKPKELTEKEWLKKRENNLADSYTNIGDNAYQLKNYEDAVNYYVKAKDIFESIKDDEYKMPLDALPKYVKSLIKLDRMSEATKVVEKAAGSSDVSEEIIELLKEVYIKNNGSEDGYEKYLEKFEAASHAMMLDKLKAEIISKPAPGFTLKTLEGNDVSLADYKGKTVILDFWATWCGPCINSFPAMQNTVDELKENEKVAFLFINTWENVENKKENALNFIKQNKYRLRVLLDGQNEVVSKYKVNGIPTKFVIDKNGQIRFQKIGFSGNAKETIDEIKTMISLIE